MNTSTSNLDPWRILLSHFMELDTYDIPRIIDRTGMEVDWSLTEKENYSHKWRRDFFRPRIITAYNSLPQDDQLRVSHTVAAELSKLGRANDANNDLKRIGWNIEADRLFPVDADVKELFFPKNTQHDAYVEIRNIFQKASKSINVIDPYIDSSILTVLKTISSQSIEVKLLTLKNKIPDDFILETKKFLSQYTNYSIEVRTTGEFHDRFILIDNAKCWHVGASIKDAGNRVFMISVIEDNEPRNALIRVIENTWINSREVQIISAPSEDP